MTRVSFTTNKLQGDLRMASKLTFRPCPRCAGYSGETINVDRNGRPYAQLWTFHAEGETHPWHVKLTGEVNAMPFRTLAEAKAWLEREAA